MRKHVSQIWLMGVLLLFLFIYGYQRFSVPETAPKLLESRSLPVRIPTWKRLRGEEWVYDLIYEGQAQWPGVPQNELTFVLKGTLSILVIQEDKDDFAVWMHIKPSEDFHWDFVPKGLQDTLRESWEQGVPARMPPRGFQLNLEEEASDPTTRQFWRSLTQRLRGELPAQISQDEWETFQPTSDGQGIQLVKSYRQKDPRDSQLEGESRMTFAPHFAGLLEWDGTFREEQSLQGQTWASASHVKLRWTQTRQANQAAFAAMEKFKRNRPTQPKGSSEEISIQTATLGALDFDTLWDALTTSTELNADDLYLKLKAWIYLHPDRLALLRERLRGRDADDPLMKMALRALAGSGQPEGQDALVDVLQEHPSDAKLAHKIITTLAFVSEPTGKAQALVEHLERSATDEELKRNAHLVIGAMGRQLAQSPEHAAQERANAIEMRILNQLRAAQGRAAILDALAVIGNFGISRIDDLARWLGDPDPEIRANAYFALRFAKPVQTPSYLVGRFASEESADARRQILQALTLRPLDQSWFQAIQMLLQAQLVDADHLALARSLVAHVRQFREPSLRLLQSLIDKTHDPSVRESLIQFQEAARNQLAI